MKKKIYLDHAASSPLNKEVYSAMLPYFKGFYANPSSVHSFGQEALAAIDIARAQAASALGAQNHELIFTSGATESNNLAIQGILQAWQRLAPKESKNNIAHIITSSIEHSSVLNVCDYLQRNSRAEVTYLPVSSEGIVEIKDVISAIRENTILISIMLVNNEIGVIEPISEISRQIAGRGIFFHCDATQAINYLDCNVDDLGVDLLSLSGHKIGGPKGVGLLYIKDGVQLEPIFHGGYQQNGYRSGTLPTALIVGMGKAMEINCRDRKKNTEHVRVLSDYFMRKIQAVFPSVIINGSQEKRIPNNVHISFDWGDGESMLIALDLEGVAVSTGSACSSGSIERSHVLQAIGVPDKYAQNSLRITFGPENSKEEMDYVIALMKKVQVRYQA